MINDDGMLGFPSTTDTSTLAPEVVETKVDTKSILEPVVLGMETTDIVEPKRKRGRPTKDSLTKTQSGDSLLQEMVREYEEGASDPEVCKTLRLPYKEFDKKIKNDADFRTLVEYGRMAAKAFWYKMGRTGMLKKGTIDYSFWQLWMKNQYGWTEKASQTNSDERPMSAMSTDELRESILQKRGKIAQLLGDTNVEMLSHNEEYANGSS